MCVSQAGSRGRCSPGLLLLPFLLLLSTPPPAQGAIDIPKDLLQPPNITELPQSTTAFALDDISLACEATGTPTPRFRWEKDGKEFGPERLGNGTLRAEGEEPLSSYQGDYRCYATNELGTAMTHTVRLITEPTPILSKEETVKMRATEGESVVLHCNTPESSTPPIFHWMDNSLIHLVRSERMTIGLDGSLYFANVLTNDSRDDYKCNAQYIQARTILPKEAISLKVSRSNDVVSNRKPHLLRPSGHHTDHHTNLQALRGHRLVLECIPHGLPTPSVQWTKDGRHGDLGGRVENFGRWLVFSSVAQDNDGDYECLASNTMGKTKHSYTVTVEAEPYWVKKPQSQLYAPGETVRLDCQADGIPAPVITWSINSMRLAEGEAGRRRVQGGVLILESVVFSDTAIYQCEASNAHGSILSNAYVYVIELPPQILSSDGVVYRVIEGGATDLHCHAFGSPRPHPTWEYEGLELLSNPRVGLLANGTLELSNASQSDAGTYSCFLKHTNINITAHLEVLNRTVMLTGPQSVRVIRGNACSLDCWFYKDPQMSQPQIVWRKDGHKIMESALGDKLTVFDNGTLRVTDVQAEDGGQYSCEVITDLDNVQASGSITVVAPPDAPRGLSVSEQLRNLTLRWTPGHSHNSPTSEFIVQMQVELKAERVEERRGSWVEIGRVPGAVNHLALPGQPYSIYRFRVLAVNELGPSEPSQLSADHSTPPAVPDSNPSGVRSNSSDPGTLVVIWKRMEARLHNGRGFQYKVWWRPAGEGGGQWSVEQVEQPPLVVPAGAAFSPFRIKVQAVNDIGVGPPAHEHLGHTGEAKPLAPPTGVHVNVSNNTIMVKWEPISEQHIQGILLGYKIYLSWLGHQGARQRRALETKEQERERAREGGGEERGMEKRKVEVVVKGARSEEKVSGLRLYSLYHLSITAFNSKGEGPHSPPLKFSTPEGAPGPPASLRFDSPSDSELVLHWHPPHQPNGVLRGYLLQYHPLAEGQDSRIVDIDSTVTRFLVDGLDPQSRYLFSLFALTAVGKGLPITREAATLLDGVPPCNVSVVGAEETSVNLSWVPGERYRNYGFHFRYLRKTAGGEWEESEQVNSTQAFYSLTGLQPGTQYHIAVTQGNNTCWADEFQTKGPVLREVAGGFATQGWFIGVISSVVLLMLLLLVLCFIKRSRGGKYAVKDKEEGQVDSEARLKDETFGEYRSLESDGEEKRSGGSQASLCVESTAGSDDSLAEYGDSVDIQFNEDGSFIGQYSGRGPAPHDNGSSGPASPTNPAPPPPLAPSLSAILNQPS